MAISAGLYPNAGGRGAGQIVSFPGVFLVGMVSPQILQMTG